VDLREHSSSSYRGGDDDDDGNEDDLQFEGLGRAAAKRAGSKWRRKTAAAAHDGSNGSKYEGEGGEDHIAVGEFDPSCSNINEVVEDDDTEGSGDTTVCGSSDGDGDGDGDIGGREAWAVDGGGTEYDSQL